MAAAWILAGVAIVAAAISAATGVAGGVILLATLVLLVPAAAVVPLHGAIQLVAGASRAVMFRGHVDVAFLRRFAVGLVPGSLLGAAAVWWLRDFDPAWLRIALGVAILLSLVPWRAPRRPPAQTSRPRWVAAFGLACGTLSMVVGSVGPLVSRGLLAHGLVKEPHVGTKAAVQMLGHALKIILFGLALDFDFGAHGWLIALVGAAVLLGTLLGRRILARVSVAHFQRAIRVLLALVATQLVVRELWRMLTPG